MCAQPDPRSLSRRSRSIRFHFRDGKEIHDAVSAYVDFHSLFIRSSHTPELQSELTLIQRYASNESEVVLRGKVLNRILRPSLDFPERGFELKPLEALTHGGPEVLRTFLMTLDPTLGAQAPIDSRGLFACFRFDLPEASMEPLEEELEELELEDALSVADALEAETRAFPRTPSQVSLPSQEAASPPPSTQVEKPGFLARLFGRKKP